MGIEKKCREAGFAEIRPLGNFREGRRVGICLALIARDHMARHDRTGKLDNAHTTTKGRGGSLESRAKARRRDDQCCADQRMGAKIWSLPTTETITIREADIMLPPVPADRTAVQSTAMNCNGSSRSGWPKPPGAGRVVARVMHATNLLSFAKDVASLTRTCGRISAIQRCTEGSR